LKMVAWEGLLIVKNGGPGKVCKLLRWWAWEDV